MTMTIYYCNEVSDLDTEKNLNNIIMDTGFEIISDYPIVLMTQFYRILKEE